MLSQDQVSKFFNEGIHFPSWETLKCTNPQDFLKRLLQKYQYYRYFNNIGMAATPEKKPPSESDSIQIGLDGPGRVCIDQNAFMAFLLQSIGFNATISAGTCVVSSQTGNEGNHCMCIIELSPEEVYAIDVGSGQPIDEPIPLHNLPYFGIAAGFRYEFRYNGHTKLYEKWQHDGTFFKGKFDEGSPPILRYTFSKKPTTYSYFSESLLDFFTNREQSIFLQAPFLFRALDLDESTRENGRRFILIFGGSLVIFDNVAREVKRFANYREMQPDIEKYFPALQSNNIEKALEYFSLHCTELMNRD